MTLTELITKIRNAVERFSISPTEMADALDYLRWDNKSIIPEADNSNDLGSANKRFKDVFSNSINTNNIAINGIIDLSPEIATLTEISPENNLQTIELSADVVDIVVPNFYGDIKILVRNDANGNWKFDFDSPFGIIGQLNKTSGAITLVVIHGFGANYIVEYKQMN